MCKESEFVNNPLIKKTVKYFFYSIKLITNNFLFQWRANELKMDEKVFVHDNDLISHSCVKLYLDAKTSDVSFIFAADADQPENIVAHKILLSAGSPVFEAMFFGSLIELGDVPIVDASPAAFKEFLQFFYMSQVRLTSRNIGEVINLCKKYELADGVKACEIPLQNSLTNNDMCWGYEVAVLLELENLQKFCERKIKENAQEILTSESFLECGRESLDKILQLVQSNCPALTVVEACMEWAKAENLRNGIESNPFAIRAQLGVLFDQIPFNEITMENFFDYLSKFHGIVSDKEVETVTRAILNKQFQSNICANLPLSILPKLNCDRKIPGQTDLREANIHYCCFESNKNLLLKEFYLPRLASNLITGGIQTMDLVYTVHGPYSSMRADLIYFEKITLTSEGETHIVLPQPVFIEANKGYSISVVDTNYIYVRELSFLQEKQLSKFVELDDDTQIKFFPVSEFASRLLFQKPTI